MRAAHGLLLSATFAATVSLAACHKEVRRDGAVPIDTAAVMPMLDTTPSSDSAAFADTAADTLRGDSSAVALPPASPSVIATADSVAGDKLFHGKGRCFPCHGERGQGTPKLGPTLSDGEWLAGNGSLASIRDVITHGVAVPQTASVAMPAYAEMLSEREIALTAAYVYALAHPGSTASDSAAAGGAAPDTAGHGPHGGVMR
ncbi:MAG TPA: c-type cytochrome [Gemmatimonadaceae bacterium]